MQRMDHIGKHATTIEHIGQTVNVRYHNTTIVSLDLEKRQAMLNSGGWNTVTTKTRINQAFNVYNVPLSVFQEDYVWYVWNHKTDETIPFKDHMVVSY